MNIEKIYGRVEKNLKKMPVWFHLIILLATMYILVCMYRQLLPVKEGFIDQTEHFTVKKGLDLYDDFYVNIYDELFYRELATQYEVGSIENITKPTTDSNLLVIGSGTGHVVNTLKEQNYNVMGLDESPSMIKYSKEQYPHLNFKLGSPMKAMSFNQNEFTHIICLNLTMYYYKNKNEFLQNIYSWLKPGGYFVVQLVDKNKFDPVVPASKPFVMVNPQSFSDNRITTSSVIFNNFKYKADFQTFPNDFVQFREIFKDTVPGSNKVRENSHNMWIPQRQTIVNIAKEVGFITLAKVDLMMAQLEYQYLYVFQKPE
jgi:SAM-dependent methyltransferase